MKKSQIAKILKSARILLAAALALTLVLFVLAGCSKNGGDVQSGTAPATDNAPSDEATGSASETADAPESSEESESEPETDAPASIPAAEVGSTVELGKYEQDNDEENGAEPIVWRVVSVDGDRALLVSDKALDCMEFTDNVEDVSWENSTIRAWLNGEFFDAAFTDGDAAVINEANGSGDKVFLLSKEEVAENFATAADALCAGTEYAYAQGLFETSGGGCWWWLRTPGTDDGAVAGVDGNGIVNEAGNTARYIKHGIRPAILVNMG